jgi:tetratricopeptide (TPR) repeat protein
VIRPLVIFVLGCVLVPSANAQVRNDAKAAKAHYEKGVVLYDLQRYEEAAAEYEAAYEAKPDPALLYNCGQAWRLAGKRDKALRAYQAYLRRMPQTPNRVEIEARIEELKQQDKAAEEKAAQDKAALEKAQRDEAAARVEQARAEEAAHARGRAEAAAQTDQAHRLKQARLMKWAGLGLGVGGVVVGVLGLGLYGNGVAAYNEINKPRTNYVFDLDTERRMNTLRPLGVSMAFIGLAAAATGWTLFGLGLTRERRKERALILPHGAFFGAVTSR